MALNLMPGVDLTAPQRAICGLADRYRKWAAEDEATAASIAQSLVDAHLKAAVSAAVAEEWRAFALEHTGIDVNDELT